jgi:hypothetical protein
LWFLKRDKRMSANAYALFSTFLCFVRYMADRNDKGRKAFHRLVTIYAGLLLHQPARV